MEKKRILIADDEARVRLIMHDSLQKMGNDYEIIAVSNGLDALHLVEQGRFDLVITDLRMPGMNGVELTRSIGETRPGTRVIWMTAYGCSKTATERARLEVYRCLDKPIEIAEIRRVVREALEGQARRPQRVTVPEKSTQLAYAG